MAKTKSKPKPIKPNRAARNKRYKKLANAIKKIKKK